MTKVACERDETVRESIIYDLFAFLSYFLREKIAGLSENLN
jgi:hypothetical protein